MKFMLIRRASDITEAAGEGDLNVDPQVLADMHAFHEEMEAAGVLIGGGGLRPSSQGRLLRVREDATTVVDGPYAESKELIAGYTVIECDSFEEALEWAKKWPTSDGPADIELRQFYANGEVTDDPEVAARFDEILSDKV